MLGVSASGPGRSGRATTTDADHSGVDTPRRRRSVTPGPSSPPWTGSGRSGSTDCSLDTGVAWPSCARPRRPAASARLAATPIERRGDPAAFADSTRRSRRRSRSPRSGPMRRSPAFGRSGCEVVTTADSGLSATPRRDRDAATGPVRARQHRAPSRLDRRSRSSGRDGRRTRAERSPPGWRRRSSRSGPRSSRGWRSGSMAPRTRRRCTPAGRPWRSSGRATPRCSQRRTSAWRLRSIAGGGAIVSELAPDVEPTHGTFPRRNRVISGLADATVVVEAPARSGALITASWALEQGRECFLVPGSIDAPRVRRLSLVPARVPRDAPGS